MLPILLTNPIRLCSIRQLLFLLLNIDHLTITGFMDLDQLRKGIPVFKLFHVVGLASSGGAARRLIEQGGGYVNGRRIEAMDTIITDKDLNKGEILLRSGKKRYHRGRVKDEPVTFNSKKTKKLVDKRHSSI